MEREVEKPRSRPRFAEVQHYKLSQIDSINADNTKASKQTRLIEKEMTVKLVSIFNEIKKEGISTTIDARTGYGIGVGDIIRSAVERIYKAAADYVAEYTGLEGFLTSIDISKVSDLTTTFVEEFWYSVDRRIFKRNTLLLRKNNLELKPELAVNTVIELITGRIATMTLNLATIYKIKQISVRTDSLISHIGNAPKTLFFSGKKMGQYKTAVKKREIQFFTHSRMPLGLPPLDQPVLVVMAWVTQEDERVCPICMGLHGQHWEVDDPNMLIPGPDFDGGSSHFRCRCRLMMVNLDEGVDISSQLF